jgi:hypothetical protein
VDDTADGPSQKNPSGEEEEKFRERKEADGGRRKTGVKNNTWEEDTQRHR